MGAEMGQAGGIEQQPALTGGIACGARGGAAGVRESDLLVVAEEMDLVGAEAKLAVGDGVGRRRHLKSVHDGRPVIVQGRETRSSWFVCLSVFARVESSRVE